MNSPTNFLLMIAWGVKHRFCTSCILDEHFKCTGVGCYGCQDSYHLRKPGRHSAMRLEYA